MLLHKLLTNGLRRVHLRYHDRGSGWHWLHAMCRGHGLRAHWQQSCSCACKVKSAASGQLWIARANVLTAVVVVTDNEHLLQRAHHLCVKCTYKPLQLRRTSKSPSSTRCLPSPECRYTIV